VNWLLPGAASTPETTIADERVAVDVTAWVDPPTLSTAR